MPIRTYSNFAGGQNNYSGPYASPIIIDPGNVEALAFSHESTNWEGAENGLIKYAGDDDVITTPASAVVTGEYDWNGTHIMCKGGKVYTVAGTSETQIYTGHTAGEFYQFTEGAEEDGTEILIMCNGTDVPLYYDGVTCTTISFTDNPGNPIWNDARPKGVSVHRGSYLWWGDPTKPYRVYKSRPGIYNSFDNTQKDADFFDVDLGYNGIVTGIKPLTDDITIIYKERCIRRLAGITPFGSDGDPFEIRPITDEYGCIAPRTIVQKGLDQYFLSEDGYRKLKPVQSYGDVEDNIPTYPIQGIMDDLNYTSTVIENACAVFHKPSKQIWLSLPSGSSTTNNLVIIHDVMTGGNDPRGLDDITASTLAIFDRKVYHGNYSGQLYKHGDDYSYHGNAVSAEWESKWIVHNALGLRKQYRELHIYAESDGEGSLVIQWTTLQRDEERTQSSTQEISSGDNAWDQAVWDSAEWGSGNQGVKKIELEAEGNAIKFRFINNANNQRIKIRMVELHYDLINSSRG